MVKKKLPFLLIFIYLFITILIGRVFYLQILKHNFFKEKSQNQIKRITNIYPNRGNIFDRNNVPITFTQDSYSAYVVPIKIDDKKRFAKKITTVIGGSWLELSKKINKPIHFMWLKRKLSPRAYKKLSKLNLEGLGFLKEQQRLYPKKKFSAHVLGFVGIDNQGLGGLEYAHDTFLKGEPGKIILEGDPRGNRLVSGKTYTEEPKNGGDIITTLDEFIQFSTEKHLETTVKKYKARSGQVIVMDPNTGEILAMAAYPDFDPNNNSNFKFRKNNTITDIFEPGSIFKIIPLGGVLEERLYDPESILTVPETLTLYNRTIKEAHRRDEDDTDKKTVTDIITESLNVGTTLMAQKLGKDKFFKYIEAFGFGKRTGIGLPGESAGLLRQAKHWSGVDIGMISFGQGVAVTPIQMVTAFSAIANGGYLLKPRIIQFKRSNDGQIIKGNPKRVVRQILQEKTARQIREILYNTVENGTGKSVKIPGFSIAGKTGTAQRAKENGLGYEKGKYIASFAGFFPVQKPKYCILVVIDSPEGSIYGSTVAGPVFKNITHDIIRQKDLIPDQVISKR